MNRLGARCHRRGNNVLSIQITFRRCRAADAKALVRQGHMQALCIRRRIYRHGLNAHFLAGADDANRDFATIGNQNLGKH